MEEELLDIGAPPIEDEEDKSNDEEEIIELELGNLPSCLPEPPSVLEGNHVNRALVKLEPVNPRQANSTKNLSKEAKEFSNKAEAWLMSWDSSERYSVDFRSFPIYFQTDEEALLTYNALGLEKKLHFKKFNVRRDENGYLYTFGLAWHKRNTKKSRLDQKLVLRDGLSAMHWPVMAKFRWIDSKKCYARVGKVIIEHTHPPEIRDRYLIQNPEIKSEVSMYLEWKLTAADVQKILNEKFKWNIQYQEVYNLMKNLKYGNNKFYTGSSDVEKFLTLVKEYKIKDPEMSYEFEYEDDNDKTKLKRAFVMTGKMKKIYQKFNDVVIIDAIYRTNKHDMPLVVFSGVTSDGSNIIFAYAVIKKEDVETYQWIMKKFIFYNDGLEPGVVLTDFDSNLWHGIERSLNTSIHLLWQFNIRHYFRKQFSYLSKRKSASANLLFRHIIETITTESPKRFIELQDIIFSSENHLDEMKFEYLRSMFSMKEKWSTAFAPNIFTAGIHTITRALSIFSQMKQRIFARSSLWDIFTLGLDLFDKVLRRIVNDMYEARRDAKLLHPVLWYLANTYSEYAFMHMLCQYTYSHTNTVKRPKDQKPTLCGRYIVKEVSEEKERYMVEISENIKECRQGFDKSYDIQWKWKYFHQNLIYWSHIFTVINILQLKNFSEFKLINRWLKSEVILKEVLTVNQRHLEEITNRVKEIQNVNTNIKAENYD